MAGEKSKTPADVLARQRAERRVWVALDGLSERDKRLVVGTVNVLLEGAPYEPTHLDDTATTGPTQRVPTPAGTEQQ